MVSRSNREARPNQVPDGGGAFMNAGTNVKPKDPEDEKKYEKQAAAKSKAPKASAAKKKEEEEESKQGRSGWDKIGDAGEDIVKTYKAKQAAKAAE